MSDGPDENPFRWQTPDWGTWENYIELVGIYYQEELNLLRSRPGWIYVKESNKLDAVGKAYQQAQDRAKRELNLTKDNLNDPR